MAREPKRSSVFRVTSNVRASHSIPRRRPFGAIASRNAEACPPPPSVASTTSSPGFGSRYERTSFRSTGIWRPAILHAEFTELFGDVARVLLGLQLVGVPGLLVPELEVVVEAGDDHVLLHAGVLPEVFGKDDPPLRVDGHVHGAGQHQAGEGAGVRLAHRHGRELVGELLPFGGRVDVQAAVEAARDDGARLKITSEFHGNREASFVIERMVILTNKHRRFFVFPHFLPRYNHYTPLSPTCPPPSPIRNLGIRVKKTPHGGSMWRKLMRNPSARAVSMAERRSEGWASRDSPQSSRRFRSASALAYHFRKPESRQSSTIEGMPSALRMPAISSRARRQNEG